VAVVAVEEVAEVEFDVADAGLEARLTAIVMPGDALERPPSAQEDLEGRALADRTVSSQQEETGVPIAQGPLGDVGHATALAASETSERKFDFLRRTVVVHHDTILP
jgi:hypothetical protein